MHNIHLTLMAPSFRENGGHFGEKGILAKLLATVIN
jgi:hypothetical protein